ncbi:Amino acid adenylation domain protein [Kitasatospora sp. MMS16-BH015]|uniref:non-ribosomal peptide synthetase n=1 Tax=Kitasatospora sp. MMS16-BH015 TaxID=2018025 RepID=UPI000CA10B8B|nr:non-ribosomal peptide synthetase [Kitasatospora sp. MMS16-BH015]AUG78204.1 Amino acid adenylation domain protein [Kitasatospora sp. MMS16-BH015]
MPDARTVRLPLTAAQAGVWAAHQLDPTGRRFAIGEYLEIAEEVDRELLDIAWRTVTAESEALRTRSVVQDEDGSLRQLIDPEHGAPLTHLDLSAEEQPEQTALALLRAELARPVDLVAGPLSAAGLIRIGEGRYWFHHRYHHIVTDGYGYSLVLKRLAAVYTALTKGELPAPSPFSPLGVLLDQDAEYRASEQFAADRAYWTGRFADRPMPARLARRAVRLPAPAEGHPQRLRATGGLDAATMRGLRTTARAAQTSWLTVAVAVTAAYLRLMTGRDDVVLALPVTARATTEARRTPAMVTNTVSLRLEVPLSASLTELIPAVDREIRAALAHQRYRHEDLCADLGLAGHDFGFLGAMVNVLSHDTTVVFGHRRTIVRNLSSGPALDVTVGLYDRAEGDGAWLAVDADPAYFTAEEPAGHLDRFGRLLADALARPEAPIGLLDLLGETERRELLEEWNDTGFAERGLCLPALFEEQAAATPEAVALATPDRKLTYRQLDAAANRLAHELIAAGVGPEQFVALALPRSPESLTATLAVLKAGAGYLPVDTSYPVERIERMLTDAAPAVVITDLATAGGLSGRLLVVDEPAQAARIAARPATAPTDADRTAPLTLAHPAYLIFTSGSTGVPKGVVMPHRGVANLAADHHPRLALGPGKRLLQLLSPSFDAAVQDIWPALLSGATLVLAPQGGLLGEELGAFLAEQRITHVAMPPVVLATIPPTQLPQLESLITGGDALETHLVQRWHAGRALRNHYGPTEASCTVSVSGPLAGEGIPHIGGPIGNTRLYVLDEHLSPVPDGVAGELYVAGAGLARGYLNRPGQSADRFLPCPYGPPGERMYRTGDLVRRTAERRLEFIGRADGQVKIRGYRIELGEIEAVLGRADSVADVIAVAQGESADDRRLVGYVVPRPGAVADPAALRALVGRSLPDFMVPAAILVLDAFPLTPNGKIDRKALPAPDFAAGSSTAKAPRTETERLLCELAAEVLAVPAMGVDESFFNRGGDSIRAIQLVALARKSGLEITAGDVLKLRTPEEIARVARAVDPGAAAEPAGAGTGPVPLIPITGWLAELVGSADRIAGFNQSMLLRAPAEADPARLAAALQRITDHHDALRLRLTVAPDGGWSTEIRPVGAVDAAEGLRRVDTAGLAGPELSARMRQAAEQARAELDPTAGRVLRAVWFDAGPGQAGRLLLVVHHLAVDGVSWRILLPDLQEAWQGAELAPVRTSLRGWATALAPAAEQRSAELGHWLDTLATPDPGLGERPLDRSSDTAARGRELRLTLAPAEAGPLLTDLPAAFRAGADHVLLTGFALALREWRRRHGRPAGSAVLLDLEAHGRQELAPGQDLSRTVGWFTSLYPVSVDPGPLDYRQALAGGPELGRALKLVKERLRTQPGDGLGYGLLRRLDPAAGAELARHAAPKVSFNYLGRFAADGGSGDWSVDPVPPLVGGADPAMPFAHELEVNAIAWDGTEGTTLEVALSWPDGLLAEAEVAELAELWRGALGALARATGGGLTPSDLPMVELTQPQLEQLEQWYPELTDVLPLTSLQEGFLFHTLIDGQDTDAYVTQLSLELTGPLEAAALRTAAERLLERHPALRAGFRYDGLAAPVQVIASGQQLPWAEVDLTDLAGLDAGRQEAEAARLAAEERSRPFDLTRPPLLRLLLLRLAPDRHRLLISNHHILWDGWSTPVLVAELCSLLARPHAALPAAPPFAGYLEWLAGQDAEGARTAWGRALAGAQPTHLVPEAAHGEPVLHRQVRTELSPELTARLTELLQSSGVTVNTLIQAAWGIFLARTSGQEDVLFGTSVSGRTAEVPELDRMVGMLTNTLPVRVELRPEESVLELLARLQEEQLALIPHHHLGLSEIQRAAGGGPLFDTTMVCLNYPLDPAAFDAALSGSGLALTSLDAADGTHYPLRLAAIPGPALRIWLGYRPDLYSAEEAEQLSDRIHRLLETVADAPHTAVGELDILTAEERAQLLVDFGGYDWGGYGG